MLRDVTIYGTGAKASVALKRQDLAGKTGTAQRSVNGRYSGYTASFIGFAPADKPRYVISVTIQAPQGLHWGGVLGGPVFKEVMSYVLEAKHIPPSNTKVKPLPLNASQVTKQ